jgi:glutaryl-CoA dehydrogenase
MLKKGIQSVLA